MNTFTYDFRNPQNFNVAQLFDKNHLQHTLLDFLLNNTEYFNSGFECCRGGG